MQLEEIRGLVRADLEQVDATIVARLASDVVLVNQVSHYIVGGGGKRLRPLSVVLAARACGYEGDRHHMLLTSFGFLEATLALPGKSWLVIWVWSMRC